jgi:hypothetical protein
MAEKRRYTVSLPDHVADAVEKYAIPLGATPTEYAGDVVRWWFGQGCPPVSADEAQLRTKQLAKLAKSRTKPVPADLNVWALDSMDSYVITDDKIVQKILKQLGLPNLFAQAAEHDSLRMSVTFDNHPTHWIVLEYFKGSDRKDGDGLAFQAYPKYSVSKHEMLDRMKEMAKEMGSSSPVTFSQIPALESPAHTAAAKSSRSVPA